MTAKTITLKPRMSEKAYAQSQTANVYVFDVPQAANKHTIARAVEEQFAVNVVKVNVVNIEGKVKRTVRKSGRSVKGKQSDIRKAYVTLKQGDSLPIFAALEQEVEKADQAASKENK